MAKFCEACGMPLTEPKEFAVGWPDNPYCVYCTDEKGTLKSYEDVLLGYANYLMTDKGVTLEEGKKEAAEAMAKLPAWKNRPKK